MNHLIPTWNDLAYETARYFEYRDKKLWYQVIWLDSNRSPHLFDFPIPVDEIEQASSNYFTKDVRLFIENEIRRLNDTL